MEHWRQLKLHDSKSQTLSNQEERILSLSSQDAHKRKNLRNKLKNLKNPQKNQGFSANLRLIDNPVTEVRGSGIFQSAAFQVISVVLLVLNVLAFCAIVNFMIK